MTGASKWRGLVAQGSISRLAKPLRFALISGIVFWLADRVLEYWFLIPGSVGLRDGSISFLKFLVAWEPLYLGSMRLGLLLIWEIGSVLLAVYACHQARTRKAFEQAASILDRSPAVSFIWRCAPGAPTEFVSENVAELFGYMAREFTRGCPVDC